MAEVIGPHEVEAARAAGKTALVIPAGSFVTHAALVRPRELNIQVGASGETPPREIDVKPNFFESPAIDNLYNIAFELGATIWVLTDRVRTLEAILERSGVVASGEIEDYSPTPEEARERKAERDRFVEQIYRSIRENPG